MRALLKATTTPLASIFGSGFLVIVPILASAVGPYSIYSMVFICGVACLVGAIIRFNILNAEPVLESNPGEALLSLERGSDLALIVAYIISVSLYLHILSSFLLTGIGADSVLNQNLLTTAIIVAIALIGIIKGLDELEMLEQWALYVTLIIIMLILLGFARYDWATWQATGNFVVPKMANMDTWQVLTIIAGTAHQGRQN